MSDLTATRDHALTMAGRSTTSAADAALWLQIAREIDAYLNDGDEPGVTEGGRLMAEHSAEKDAARAGEYVKCTRPVQLWCTHERCGYVPWSARP